MNHRLQYSEKSFSRTLLIRWRSEIKGQILRGKISQYLRVRANSNNILPNWKLGQYIHNHDL